MTKADPGESKRDAARKALAGEERYANLEKELSDLTKRRQDARHAMESSEQKRRRETNEQIAGRKATTQATLEAKRKRQAENKKRQEEAVLIEKRRVSETAAKAKQKRVSKIQTSQEKIEQLKNSGSTLSPIRTYTRDFARAVKNRDVSAVKIALSEQKRKTKGLQQTTKIRSNRKTPWLLIIVIILIIGGGIVAYMSWPATDTGPVTPAPTPSPDSLIFSEYNKPLGLGQGIEVPKASLDTEADLIESDQLYVKTIYFLRGQSLLTFNALRQTFDLGISNRLSRNLNPEFSFGVYHDEGRTSRFLILESNIHEQAYAGFIEWEDKMLTDLLPLLYSGERQPPAITPNFSDKRIRNKDIRLLTNPDGDVLLLYVFLDQNHILITTSEGAFDTIFQRFITGAS
ncbi:MAG: hypothetical protein U9M92_01600 [Patescibacteria group bacterium]|nr:hypothetical protein [Patescibacteria group bacterium]